MRILLVEDDAILGDGILAGLKLSEHAVDWVRDGEAARLALLDHSYEACVLDLGLPKRDGIAVLKELRERGNRLPVLILTARDSVEDRIRGLDAGADDYLVKPFAFAELSARLDGITRRARGDDERAPTRLQTAGLELDLLSREALREGRRIELQPREFRLLEYLMRHAGQVVTRTMLLEAVWDYHFDPQTNVIDVHISRLRQKIDHGFDKPLLHTVRGAGYRLSG